MPTATVTSKGQVTIPKAIRDALHLDPGDRVAFVLLEDGTVSLVPATTDLRTLRGVVRPRRRGVTLEEMERVIRARGGGS